MAKNKLLKKNLKQEVKTSELAKLLTEHPELIKTPLVGEIVKGNVLSASNREIRIDLSGWGVGVVRGNELYLESQENADLKPGDEVEATVVEAENENGEVELSIRSSGHKKVWDSLKELMRSGQIVQAEIIDANRGGLLIKINRVSGFLPVSQLSPEHYPRVPGGDKNKILEKLKSYVKEKLDVKIITADEEEEKLIVSGKAAWEEAQHGTISKYQVGDVVEGKVTAVTDFGAFVKFGENLEGLIHISELAWQRIDDPKDYIKVSQTVKAKIINVDGSKIFLSTKSLQTDPWANVGEKYKIGQIVTGKVLKINPFGLFVELDPEIHGLAHISELSDKSIEDMGELAKIGDELEFKIISIEPKDHRLGLSLKEGGKTEGKKNKKAKAEPEEVKKEKVEEEVKEESAAADASAPTEVTE